MSNRDNENDPDDYPDEYPDEYPDDRESRDVDDELAEFTKSLADFDLLPLFERQHYAFTRTKLYALSNNEKLRNRWRDRVRGNQEVGAKKTMPTIRDYHFHNCRTKLAPSHTISNFPSFRFHLQPGPGVDKYGQRPIPDNMHMRKPDRKSTPASKKTKQNTQAKETIEAKKK